MEPRKVFNAAPKFSGIRNCAMSLQKGQVPEVKGTYRRDLKNLVHCALNRSPQPVVPDRICINYIARQQNPRRYASYFTLAVASDMGREYIVSRWNINTRWHHLPFFQSTLDDYLQRAQLAHTEYFVRRCLSCITGNCSKSMLGFRPGRYAGW